MAYLDFDTLVVCNHDFSEVFLADFFPFFHELGIRNFIFTYDFDVANRSVSEGLRLFRTLKPYLHRYQPRGTRVYTAINVILDQDVSYNQDLCRLALPQGNRMFISLPIFTGNEWLETELSRLVYRKRMQPIFTSFERNAITYSVDMLERFSRIPQTIFCLDANYMFSLRAQSKLTSLLCANVRILPCISNHMSDYVGIFNGYADLKNRLGLPLYQMLCKNMRESSISLRKDFIVCPRR